MTLRFAVLFACCCSMALANRPRRACNPEKCPGGAEAGARLTLLPVPWDCGQYIMCQWGEAHYRPCGFGLYYDHSRTVCVPPNMTKCVLCNLSEREIEDDSGENINSSADASDPITQPEDDIDSPEKDENENNKPSAEGDQNDRSQTILVVTESLMEGDIEDPKTENSGAEINSDENKESSRTTTETEPKTDTTTIQSGSSEISQRCIQNSKTSVTCPENMSDDRLMPHPDDCGLFYYCVDYVTPICRECPADLYFNPQKKVCDFQERAGCRVQLPSSV